MQSIIVKVNHCGKVNLKLKTVELDYLDNKQEEVYYFFRIFREANSFTCLISICILNKVMSERVQLDRILN